MASGLRLAFFLSLISGFVIAGTMSQDVQAQQACDAGWTQFGSRCFIFYHMPKTWTDAEHTCISVGGNLASVHNGEENEFLRNLVERVTGYRSHAWIGGYDAVTEGTWLWSDGSKFDYRRWSLREPSGHGENCMLMNWGGNYWNDYWCYYRQHFICAKNV